MRVFILEDQKKSRMALERILRDLDEKIIVRSAGSEEEGEQIVLREEFDLFLLDINLHPEQREDTSGLIFAARLRGIEKYTFTPIVMITSVASLEMSAYRQIHCYQYLIKPYDRKEVENIVCRVAAHLEQPQKKSIVVKKDGINYRIPCDDIVYIRAVTRGVTICMKREQMEVKYLTLRQIMEQLPEEFIQCHRMYVIHRKYVDYVDLVNQIIRMQGYKDEIEIGKTYKAEVKRRIYD
jgi:two-component system LytT family response regulator